MRGPHAHITARIHVEVYDAIEKHASAAGVNFSEAVRQLLLRGLIHAGEEPEGTTWDFGSPLDQEGQQT